MPFQCNKGCGRTLPDWMDTGGGVCTTCSSETTTEETKAKFSSDSEAITRNQGTNQVSRTDTGSSSQPVGLKLSNEEVSTDNSIQLYICPDLPEANRQSMSCDIFALGRYDTNQYKAHSHSKKIIEFAKNEDMRRLSYFQAQLETFFDLRVEKYPETITVYPGHDGDISNALERLAKETVSSRETRYREYLARLSSRPRQREQDYSERLANQQGSITVQGDPEEETIFLLDDIVTSGASMMVGARNLREQGANKVIGVCLGLATNQGGQLIKRLSKESHTVTSVISES